MESIIAIFSSIFGGIGLVWGIFKKQENEYEKYKEKYYLQVLEPLIIQVVNNNSSIENEVMPYINKEYHCIPTYLSYLIHLVNRNSQRYSWIDVKKVVTMDYLFNRPSLGNSFINGIQGIKNKGILLWNLICLIWAVLCMVCGIAMSVLGVSKFISMITKTDPKWTINNSVFLFIAGLIIIFIAIITAKSINMGEYELYPKSIEKIEKIIESRVNDYNSLEKEYIKQNENAEIKNEDMLFLNVNK